MANRKVLAIREGMSLTQPSPSKPKLVTRFEPGISDNPEIEQLKDDIRKMITDMMKDTPFAQGRLIEMKFVPEDQLIVIAEHKLGRRAKGFVPCGINRVRIDAALYPSFIMIDPFGDPAGYPSVVGPEGKFGKRADTHVGIAANMSCTAQIWVY